MYLAANQYIIMISEESCDTEAWSNNAVNSAAHHSNNLHLKYENRYLEMWNVTLTVLD